jgi:rRNA processing protein Gar1
MVTDRTIVVESVATGGSAPLDEGSLLVIRVQNEVDDKEMSRLMPLGKVFEVFGPVSRPLYTVRLPPANDKRVKKIEKETSAGVDRDADEISLNDEEPEVQGESREGEPVAESTSMEGEPSALKTVSSASNTGKEEQDGSNKVDGTESDPWAQKGKYTNILESTKGMPVYYIPDIAKLLDTGAVIRNSGRGCGEWLMSFVNCVSLRVSTRSLRIISRRCVESIR